MQFGDVGTNQLVVPKVTFGQATSLASFFAGDPLDGILGLAFQSLSVNNVKPVFQEAIDQSAFHWLHLGCLPFHGMLLRLVH